MNTEKTPQEIRSEIDRRLELVLPEEPIVQAMAAADLSKEYKKYGITKKIVLEQLENLRKRIRESMSVDVDQFDGLPPGVVIPSTYRLTKAGVEKCSVDKNGNVGWEKVAATPLFVSRKSRDIDDDKKGVELTFYYDGRPHTLFLHQSQIAVVGEILKLSSYGVPVTSVNAYTVIEYLAEQQAVSMATLSEALTTSRSGWIELDGGLYFAFGEKVIAAVGAKEISRRIPDGMSKEVRFVGISKGSMQEWLKAFKIGKRNRLVLFQVGCALVAPLLHPLRIQPFTVHFHDDSTSGKTVAMRLSLSTYGDPNDGRYLATWDTTEVGLENRCHALNHLAAAFDESTLARSQQLIEHGLYAIGNGSGRSRGTQAGEAREAKSFTVVALSSGEGLLLSSTTKTGQSVRTIQVKRNPWESSEKSGIEDVESIVKENFGFLGPAYLQHLVDTVNDPTRLQALRDRYRNALQDLKSKTDNKLVGRTLPMLAGIKVALEIAATVMPKLELMPAEIDGSINEILKIQNESLNKTSTTAFKAFQYVIDQIQANPGRFDGCESKTPTEQGPLTAVRERWGVTVKRVSNIEVVDGYAFIKAQLFKLLRDGGFDPESVCHQFRERKWVVLDQQAHLPNVKIDGKGDRRFVFDMAIAEELGALESDEEAL